MKIKSTIAKCLSILCDFFIFLPQKTEITLQKDMQFFPKYSKDWEESGAKNQEEYQVLIKEACGIACIRTVLSFWKRKIPPPITLMQEAISLGLFDTGKGINLSVCGRLLKDFKLKSKFYHYVSVKKNAAILLNNRPLIISIKGTSGGHLVVVHGVTIEKRKPRFVFCLRS